MANEVAKTNKQSLSVALEEKLDSIADALPTDLNKARFVQNAITLCNSNPDLAKFKPAQLISGFMQGAILGLDAISHECFLIPYGQQLNFQISYTGMQKLAKKYSVRPIKDIYGKLVREGDEFEELIVDGRPSINFKPLPFNDNPIIGAFAVALFEDGGQLYETMSMADLENTRKQSKASNSPAWKNFPGEMYRKTVIRRLCKAIELDFENANQRMNFDADMEIETDIKEQVKNEIEAESNQEEFIIDAEVVDVPEDEFEGTPFK